MAVREGTVEVSVPPERAYAYLRDVTRHPEWAAHRIALTHVDGPPHGVGARYATSAAFVGKVTGELRVVEDAPPERFVYDVSDTTGTFQWLLLVAPNGQGSRVTYRMEPLKVPWLLNLMVDLFLWRLVGQPAFDRTLRNLKVRIEAAA